MIGLLLAEVLDSTIAISGGITVAAIGVAFGAGVAYSAMRARLERAEAAGTAHKAEDDAQFSELARRIDREVEMAARFSRDEARRHDKVITILHDRIHDHRNVVANLEIRMGILEDRASALDGGRGQLTPRPAPAPRRPTLRPPDADESGG